MSEFLTNSAALHSPRSRNVRTTHHSAQKPFTEADERLPLLSKAIKPAMQITKDPRGYGIPDRSKLHNIRILNWNRANYSDIYYWALRLEWRNFFLAILILSIATALLFSIICYPFNSSFKPPINSFFEQFLLQVMIVSGFGLGSYNIQEYSFPRDPQTGELGEIPVIFESGAFCLILIMCLESLFKLLFFSLLTGLVYARLAKPAARIRFTDAALIHREGAKVSGNVGNSSGGLEYFSFRLANDRLENLINAKVECTLSMFVTRPGKNGGPDEKWRSFFDLPLVRDSIPNFSLPWTIMHAIDENSPLFEKSLETLQACDAVVFVTVSGHDVTFSTECWARTSFSAHNGEILYQRKWLNLFEDSADPGGIRQLDMKFFNQHTAVDYGTNKENTEIEEIHHHGDRRV